MVQTAIGHEWASQPRACMQERGTRLPSWPEATGKVSAGGPEASWLSLHSGLQHTFTEHPLMMTLVTKKRPSPDAQAAPKLVLTAATEISAAAERVGQGEALTVGNENFPPNKMPEILK